MKLFKIIWSFISPLADIIGILGFFGISIKNINFNNISFYLYVVLIIFTLILLKIIIKKIEEIKIIYEDTKINEDLEKISSQKNIQNIKKALPTTSTVLRLYEKAKTRINNWADDAIVKSVNLYIDYSDGSWNKPSLQVIAYSEWKNEEGWFYEGRSSSEQFNESERLYLSKSIVDDNIFFKSNPKWQIMVQKAFDAVSGKLTNKCRIRIQDESIYIDFIEGKVKKSKKFKTTDNFNQIIAE